MKTLHLSAIIGLAISLSACEGTVNRGLESVHQPVVSRADYVYDLPVMGDSLAPQDQQRLHDWFGSLRIKYGDRISVDYAEGSRNGSVQAEVGSVAARFGLLVDDVAPVTKGEIAPGNARVVVSRMQASVPGCPDWSRPSFAEFEGAGSPNYGCAMNSNLAAMVADPQDLVEGREHTDSFSAIRNRRSGPSNRGGNN
jgi:pilus assembly protein CpaD